MKTEEADEVSRLVTRAIEKGFSGVYAPEVIQALVQKNSTDAILKHAPKQTDYVLHSHGRIVGMTGLKRNEIGHLFVHPQEFGKGRGRMLVRFARKTFREAGYEDMVVLASLNATGFYRQCGFREEGPGHFEVGDGLDLDYVTMRGPTAEECTDIS